jgi:hypothetical protein
MRLMRSTHTPLPAFRETHFPNRLEVYRLRRPIRFNGPREAGP